MGETKNRVGWIQKFDKSLQKIEILDGFMLKIIATVTMVIDHIAVVFINRMPEELYISMRIVGRVSFPIFAFLLVEGFIHSSNRINYLARILGFGVVMMFALAILSTFGVQVPVVVNIFITLGIGFMAIWFIEQFWETSAVICGLVVLGLLFFADNLHADYGAYGVAVIIMFYLTHGKKFWMAIGFIVLTILSVGFDQMRYEHASVIQLYAIVAIPLLLMYNGEPGKYRFKYFFYFFYPIHFVILVLIRYFLYGY